MAQDDKTGHPKTATIEPEGLTNEYIGLGTPVIDASAVVKGELPERKAMWIEGIWTAEVYGPFGWENRGVLLFEKGRVVGGDNRQCSLGTYSLSGDDVKAELHVYYYGPPRTAFGEVREEFSTEISGKLNEEEINGTIRRPDRPQFDMQVRLTRRLDLPAA